MLLAAGTRLGRYEVVSPAGSGGMGEVYRARDLRLDRTVALKVLPEHLADDPEFRERLDREARAISQLTHPNICTLYDVGEAAGAGHGAGTRHFLVMEYLEGETLAMRLGRGRLPVEDVPRIAADMARALDAADRRGIVHRDLKPGNVMLTKAGAKLLDFGLAKTGPAGALAEGSACRRQERSRTGPARVRWRPPGISYGLTGMGKHSRSQRRRGPTSSREYRRMGRRCPSARRTRNATSGLSISQRRRSPV